MEDRLSRLEKHMEELLCSLRDVEQRLSRLEARHVEDRHPLADRPAGDDGTVQVTTAAAEAEVDSVGALALIGRTLLAMAGAYLLRYLTSEELLPQTVGVAAGLAYAALWILLADRAGARNQVASAAFHGATAVLLAVPLIWERTVRFAILSPSAGASALAALTGLALFAAWRRSLRSLAWIVTLGVGGSALMLGGPTHAPAPFALYLVLLGVATLELGRDRGWKGLTWVTAGLADLAVLLLLVEDPLGKGSATLSGVISIQLVFAGLYAAAFARQAWRSDQGVTLLAVVQTAAVTAVGYGGAAILLWPAAAPTPGALALGAASLLLAGLLYALAFFGLDRPRRRSALFFTSLAIPLVLVGSALLFDHAAYFWALLALVGAALGSRFARLTLSLHAAVYALAASLASGLLHQTAAAWIASPGGWIPLAGDGWLALAATAACLALPVSGDHAFWRRYSHLPKLVFLVLVVAAAGGLLVTAVALLPAAHDAGIVATLRTAILAAAALALAVLGRLEGLREATSLVYPVLILGAVKLLLEDFPAGRPETLFIALGLYGTSLIFAPRLRRVASR